MPSARLASAALVLFGGLHQDLNYFIAHADVHKYFEGIKLDFSLNNPYVVVGLLLAGCCPTCSGRWE